MMDDDLMNRIAMGYESFLYITADPPPPLPLLNFYVPHNAKRFFRAAAALIRVIPRPPYIKPERAGIHSFRQSLDNNAPSIRQIITDL